MSARRERNLAEIGLGPRWRLRSRHAASDDGTAADVVSPVAESAAARFAEAPDPHPSRGDQSASLVLDDRAARIARMEFPELKRAVAECVACDLCKTRNNTVFGVGDERAQWLVVGEAPGAEEDARGEPFVGQAGRLLDSMLAAIGLSRDKNVYICNVLKCRPPGNRNPEPFEVGQCAPHLLRQLEMVRP